MHANNEVGTIQPIAELSRVARERGNLSDFDATLEGGRKLLDAFAISSIIEL